MPDLKRIVILGAGYAGVEAAKVLGKKFKKDDSVEITLINDNPFQTLLTELHEIAGRRTEKESVMVDLYKVFKAIILGGMPTQSRFADQYKPDTLLI